MHLQNSIFSTPITSTLNAMHCDEVLSHYFGVRSTPVLLQWHVGDPGHSAKGEGGRLQLNTHTPYVCGFARSGMVIWCTQNLRQDGCSFTWHHPCQCCKCTALVNI